jgi:hypothetical protein
MEGNMRRPLICGVGVQALRETTSLEALDGAITSSVVWRCDEDSNCAKKQQKHHAACGGEPTNQLDFIVRHLLDSSEAASGNARLGVGRVRRHRHRLSNFRLLSLTRIPPFFVEAIFTGAAEKWITGKCPLTISEGGRER